jgi:hypothetical protein
MRSLRSLAVALAATLSLAAAPTAGAAVLPAADASNFRNSFGVQTHITYYDTAYKNWPALVDKLDEAGIDYLRDGLFANPNWADWNERYYQAVEYAASHGKRFMVGMGRPGWTMGTIDQLVDVAAGRLRPAIDILEGPNEQDLFSGLLTDWAPPLRDYQADLAAAVRAEPRLAGVPIVGPSLGRMSESAAVLGNLTPSLDVGNMHPYTGGQAPSPGFTRYQLGLARLVSGGRAVVASEAGFHNAMNATSGQPPVPEDVAAGYTLRTFIEHFLQGVPRTYAYELIDEGTSSTDPEKSFGLLRADLSEKPAFTALKRLLAVLGRPQPIGAAKRALDVTIGTGVDKLLLQRAPGDYQLILWQPASTWNTTTRTRTPVPAKTISLALPTKEIRVARPVQTGTQTTVKLAHGRGSVDVGADPVVLSFRTA